MKTPYHFFTKTCPYCRWPFQYSTYQEERVACAACESNSMPKDLGGSLAESADD